LFAHDPAKYFISISILTAIGEKCKSWLNLPNKKEYFCSIDWTRSPGIVEKDGHLGSLVRFSSQTLKKNNFLKFNCH